MIANGSFHLHWYPRLARRMSTFDPQVVHVEEEPYNLATWHATRLARRRGRAVVGFTWQNLARRYPTPFRAMQAHVLAHTDHFIAGSVEAEQVLRSKGYRGPTSIVPQVGVDPDEFAPDAGPRPHRPFTIGYAGRLVPEKGVDLLISAASRLPDGARIAIIGSGPERERLIALSPRAGSSTG